MLAYEITRCSRTHGPTHFVKILVICQVFNDHFSKSFMRFIQFNERFFSLYVSYFSFYAILRQQMNDGETLTILDIQRLVFQRLHIPDA